jgi:F-type H+-transporting ATPase subunit b
MVTQRMFLTYIVAVAVASARCIAADPQQRQRDADATSPVHAADYETAAEGHGAHAPTLRGKPAGEDNLLEISPPLFGWTLIVFLVFFFVMTRFVWRPILHAFEERERHVEESLADAKRVREETQRLLEKHDEAIDKAHDEAKRILEAARADAARESEALLAEARSEASAAEQRARDDIAAAQRDALAQLERGAVALAAQLAAKVADRSFQPEDAKPLLTETRP